MKKYLKACYRLTLKVFQSDGAALEAAFDELDAAEAHNEAILADVIEGLNAGRYDYASIRNRKTGILYIFTRSLRGEFVQLSRGRNDADGDIIFTGHHDIKRVSDLPFAELEGNKITIKEAA